MSKRTVALKIALTPKVVAGTTSKGVSGITPKVITSNCHCFNIANEHDVALDVIPVLHLDVIP